MSQENKSSFLIDGCQEMFQKTPVRRGRYQSSFIRPICFFSEAEAQTIKQISLFTVERRDQPSPIVGASTRQFRRAKIRQENAHDSISLSNRSSKRQRSYSDRSMSHFDRRVAVGVAKEFPSAIPRHPSSQYLDSRPQCRTPRAIRPNPCRSGPANAHTPAIQSQGDC